jgi:elongation factor 1-alpha
MLPLKNICLETFENYPGLGRFVIRDNKKTIGVGIIKEVNKRDY